MNLKIFVSTALIAFPLTGCGVLSQSPQAPVAKTFTMSGRVLVSYGGDLNEFVMTGSLAANNLGVELRKEGSACPSLDAYPDVSAGAQVTVTDEKGTVVGASALRGGIFTTIAPKKYTCAFGFTVANVPLGRTFYGVAVSHRGIVQFTPDSAKTADLTLGS